LGHLERLELRNPKQLPLKPPLVGFRKDTNFSFTHQIPSTWDRTSTYPALQRNGHHSETNQPTNNVPAVQPTEELTMFSNRKTKEEIPKLANFYHLFNFYHWWLEDDRFLVG